MKKLLLIFVILIILLAAVLVILHYLNIFSLPGLVKERFRQLAPVQTYFFNVEEKASLLETIEDLEKQLVLARKDHDELVKQLVLVNQLLAEKEKTLEDLINKEIALEEAKVNRQERVKQMAAIYNEMAPASAAEVLARLAEDMILEMLPFWDERFSAKVFASLDSVLAARLTELMAK